MNPILNHINHFSVQLPFPLTPGYKNLLIPGAAVKLSQGTSGTILIQDIIQPDFQIHYQVYDFQIPIQIPAHQEKTFLIALLSLKNSIQYFVKDLGQFSLKQGQFALLQTFEQETSISFDKKNVYQILEISWSKELVQQVSSFFKSARPLFSNKNKTRSLSINRPGQPADTHMLDIAQSILKSPYNNEISLLYFRYKVQEFLLSILKETDKNTRFKIPLTQEEYEKIISISERLMNHKNQRFPISSLAKEAKMNEMKLKQAFKKIFGQGIFEFQLAARMNEALRLLKETDLSTKAIASMVGYELGTSFITKFREYFGYSPGEIDKHM